METMESLVSDLYKRFDARMSLTSSQRETQLLIDNETKTIKQINDRIVQFRDLLVAKEDVLSTFTETSNAAARNIATWDERRRQDFISSSPITFYGSRGSRTIEYKENGFYQTTLGEGRSPDYSITLQAAINSSN